MLGFLMTKLRIIIFILSLFVQNIVSAETGLCKTQASKNQSVSNHLNDMCNIIVKSDACKEIAEEDLIKFNSNSETAVSDIWGFVKGCTSGVLESAKELLTFLWDVINWAWDNSTSSKSREATSDAVAEYSNMAKLYLHTEFEKAYSRSSPPLQNLEAVQKMGGAVSKLLVDSLGDIISKNYEEFGCLNVQAKSKVMCKFIGEVFLPPAQALALLKYGPKATKQLPNLASVFNKAKPVVVLRRIKYRTIKLSGVYAGETEGKVFGTKVMYFTEAKAAKLKVSVSKEGKLLDISGKPLNVEKGIYVMDATGEIFIQPESIVGKIHHSSILAGKPVAAAGEITVEKGIIKYIDRNSGHYRPSAEKYKQVLDELESQGVVLSKDAIKNRGY
ncbi:MAG: hypothetical protein Q7U04_05015 [Bacteriovorax sp.]|nr:hypothetical protein [Bacteriovorax sp.]